MPASFEAIDAEWFAYHNNVLGSTKSDNSKLATSPTRSGPLRSETRVVVEARDVTEETERKNPPQVRTRSQSVVRGQQHESRSRSRTLSPQPREQPRDTDPLAIHLAQKEVTGEHGLRKTREASEKHSKGTYAAQRARETGASAEKSKNDESKDNSVKTKHHSNTEARSTSPASHNNMYTTPRRTSSSLSSTLSTHREEAHAAAVLQRGRKSPPKHLSPKGFDGFQDKALMKKQQQSALRKAGMPSHRTDISYTEGATLIQTPRSLAESSITASPSIIYQALRTGNSSSLSQSLLSPHNLNDALRGSTSDVSAFQDFHNPNVKYNTPLLPTPPSSLSKGRRSYAEDAASVSTATSSVLRQRLVLKSPSRSFDSSEEMTYYHYVSRHSILQLCTEDLMSDNWKLVDYALYRLCEICCTAEANVEVDKRTAAANRIRFIKAGGHALLVGVMKKYASVTDLQTSACRLIQNFILLDQEGAFGELFASVYGMDRVLAAMQRFPDNEDNEVFRYACAALAAIVCSGFKMVQRLMQDPRNLRVFLEAMHSDANQNAVGICRVLNYISKQPDYHNEIVIAGGLEEITGEMKLYPDNKEVQFFGCETLGNLVKSSKSADTVEILVNKLDGAQLIGAAMKAFPTFEELQETATNALFHFSSYRGMQASIKRAAGLSALGIALENFPGNKAIQEHGCAAMKRLLETVTRSSSD